jgi:hypothetical protein
MNNTFDTLCQTRLFGNNLPKIPTQRHKITIFVIELTRFTMQPQVPKKPLELNKDYYIENGFYVFTEEYHRKRGYCCKNGCRHCPYGFKKIDKVKE